MGCRQRVIEQGIVDRVDWVLYVHACFMRFFIEVCIDVSGILANPARMGFKSIYAMQSARACSSRMACDLKRFMHKCRGRRDAQERPRIVWCNRLLYSLPERYPHSTGAMYMDVQVSQNTGRVRATINQLMFERRFLQSRTNSSRA